MVCDTVTDILLDTGSYGLRVFNQALKNVTAGSGPLAECAFFGDGSSEWGPVTVVDVYLGNEPAARIPIQVIDSTFASVPASCGIPDASPADAGFNGILGVGVFAEDCGTTCSDFADNGLYFSCSGLSCAGVAVPLLNQVQNPVASLPTDNNGVIVELPSIPVSGAPSVNGILVLGIGTESNNNVPAGVTTFNTDPNGEISTVFNGITYSSFIDSGSNGLFFPAPSLPICPSQPGWFCPSPALLLSATNQSATALNPSEVLFLIDNLANLLGPAGPYVFSDVGGSLPNLFDLGLPIYLGRNVFVGIDGQVSSLGTGPYIAY
jgi:uncharacterized protein DUF3443